MCISGEVLQNGSQLPWPARLLEIDCWTYRFLCSDFDRSFVFLRRLGSEKKNEAELANKKATLFLATNNLHSASRFTPD